MRHWRSRASSRSCATVSLACLADAEPSSACRAASTARWSRRSVRALGKDEVLGLFMPERDSSSDSLRLGRAARRRSSASTTVVEDIAPALEAWAATARQDEAIRAVVPEYGAGWKCKLVLASILESDR